MLLILGTTMHTLRLIIESVFCYFIYSRKSKNNTFQKLNVKKIAMFSSAYTILLSVYMYFFDDYTIYRLVSVFLMFVYFWFNDKENKISNIKKWSYILTFSIFINLILEFSHFIGYIISLSFMKYTNLYDLKSTNFILAFLYYFSILVFHSCFIFFMYRFHFIKMQDIKNISVIKQIPILFGLCLSSVIYIKYHYNQTYGELHSSVLLWILMFLLPIYLGFYHALSKLAELKNMKRNELYDINLEEKIEQPLLCKVFSLDQYRCEHKPCAAKYEADKIAFKRVLRRLGVHSGFKGFTQLVFSLLLTKNFLNYSKGWTIENNVINYIALATGDKPSEIRKDFGNIIRKVWLLEDLQVIKNEYANTNNIEDNPPSVDEFLVHMAKKPVVDEAYMLNEQMF